MKERILSILKELGTDRDYENSTDFIDEGLLDSFEIVELVEKLEEEFGIEIGGRDIVPENFTNMETIEKLVLKYKGEA